MRSLSPFSSSIVTAIMAIGVASCQDAPSEVSHESLHDAAQAHAMAAKSSASGSEALVKALHSATARYHSTGQATKAGYEVASPCVAAPGLGGMGFHWVKGPAVDPVFNAMEPEAVLYEPDKHGNMKLVAIEYIVVDIGQPAPTFGGQPFDVGGAPLPVPHWTLHVWLHKDNPNGIFTPFNPAVICP